MAVAEAPSQELTSGSLPSTSQRLAALVLTSSQDGIDGWRIKLELEGYDVVETSDVDTALGCLVAAAPPDIAILDGVHAAAATDRLLACLGDGRAPLKTAILVSRLQRPSGPAEWTSGREHRLELLGPAAA